MTIKVYDATATNPQVQTLLTTASGVTDSSGNVAIPLNIGVCQGQGTVTGSFQTTSYPADHYSITYNPNSFAKVFLSNGRVLKQSSYAFFTHICQETYLGSWCDPNPPGTCNLARKGRTEETPINYIDVKKSQ